MWRETVAAITNPDQPAQRITAGATVAPTGGEPTAPADGCPGRETRFGVWVARVWLIGGGLPMPPVRRLARRPDLVRLVQLRQQVRKWQRDTCALL